MGDRVSRRKFAAMVGGGAAAALPILNGSFVIAGGGIASGTVCRTAVVSSDGLISEYRVHQCGTYNESLVVDVAGLPLGDCSNPSGSGCYSSGSGVSKALLNQDMIISPTLPDEKLREAANFVCQKLKP